MGKTGGIPIDQRYYSCIGTLGKIKILQCDKFSNNPTITYSNTANTVYFSYSKEHKRIEHIYYYKNHKLVKSVDINPGVTPHCHYWNSTIVGRKSHSKNNNHKLSARDFRLVSLAREYDSKH